VARRDREATRAYNAAYYATNRERLKARQRAYTAANRESVNEKARLYSAAHQDERRKYRLEHREERRALNVLNRARIRAIIVKAKSSGCVDCGFLDVRALDFDHVRGRKSFTISDGNAVGVERLLAEIAKCEVRCANCHRIRTVERRLAAA
jgi:hypothetical protein